MRRAPWLLPALASLLAVCGTATASPSPSDGEDRVPKLLSGREVLAEHHWRGPAPTAPKVPTLGFVREQGGLWRLDVPADAGGELRTVRGREDAPRPADRVATVRVEVEAGLGVDGQEFARQVMATLNDPRGWGHDGSVAFARTDGEADIDVTLASPATTDALCAPVPTRGRVSCGRVGFAVLNAERWAHGAEPFLAAGGTVAEYRHYLVNHEVGHVLGHPHVACPAPGTLAPVMVQQTLDVGGCRPNGWPAPEA